MRKKVSVVFGLLSLLGAGFLCAFDVDFNREIEPMSVVHGMNLWPVDPTEEELMKPLNIPSVRLHDAPIVTDGPAIDVGMIFPDLNADPSNPENYKFDVSDQYIRRILDQNIQILYRLGTSDFGNDNPYAGPIADPQKYAEICAGIVRHYNKGWANGYEWNLRFWEIWDESNMFKMWRSHDYSTFIDFYTVVAKRLHDEFPEIKIGGPSTSKVLLSYYRQLVKACQETGAPLDFIAWHCFTDNPDDLYIHQNEARAVLRDWDHYDRDFEFILDEWHYFPMSFDEFQTPEGEKKAETLKDTENGFNGIDAAAYIGYALTRFQNRDLVMTYYYSAPFAQWGLFREDHSPYKTYYAFLAFARLVQDAPIRVFSTDQNYTSVLAGLGENGKKGIMVSNWQQNMETLKLRLKGVPESGTVTVQRLDTTTNNGFVTETVDYTGSELVLKNRPGSFILLITFP